MPDQVGYSHPLPQWSTCRTWVHGITPAGTILPGITHTCMTLASSCRGRTTVAILSDCFVPLQHVAHCAGHTAIPVCVLYLAAGSISSQQARPPAVCTLPWARHYRVCSIDSFGCTLHTGSAGADCCLFTLSRPVTVAVPVTLARAKWHLQVMDRVQQSSWVQCLQVRLGTLLTCSWLNTCQQALCHLLHTAIHAACCCAGAGLGQQGDSLLAVSSTPGRQPPWTAMDILAGGMHQSKMPSVNFKDPLQVQPACLPRI